MLDEYRRGYVDFCEASNREYYLYLSGQKPSLEIVPIYERFGGLFSRDAIARLKENLEETPEHFETERSARSRLLMFAVEQFLEDSAKRLTEEISRYEAAASIEWLGRRMTFQDSVAAIVTEPDRESRKGIYNRRLDIIESSNDLRAERLSLVHSAAVSLGYASYLALFEVLNGIDYRKVAREAGTFLEGTETLYIARLEEDLKREMGIQLAEAERSDALRLLHLTGYDDLFPARDLLYVYRATLAGLGIQVDAQKNIEIDSEPRPRKSARAFCLPISVPGQIKLVIRPLGGQSDYQAFLHESGHAQHYGGASESLLPEFKYRGDYALTEMYAFLFNHLVTDSSWLESMLGFRDSRNFVRSALLARLLTIRRYAAKLLYECELHSGGDHSRGAELYAELQTGATSFKTSGNEFLYDLDDSFYSASYVRAWAFEIMLREYLKSRFGKQWWQSRRAGGLLREIWATGDRYTADEMAGQIGLGPMGFDMLVEEFKEGLE
jgi:hypothetical protein